ncbi:hypothetical protein OPT61_g5665 [Boeremia exigua]|uniref:Uncharacterized protein n=1 Tax=Boeremia exigua TaxID=749465 RepID=A0ACC2I9L1_9PLEO|nr:hypothetical protein OPT61_g5665 [Boeremia exigua]
MCLEAEVELNQCAQVSVFKDRFTVEGQGKKQDVALDNGRLEVQLRTTHDMMAHECVPPAAGQIKMRSFVTGQIRCVCRAWCHARLLLGPGLHSKSTTESVDAVDHRDIQVGRSPAGASVDQVQGIQEGTGLQAGERMGTAEKHQTRRRLGCCNVNQPSTSGGCRRT